MALLRAISKQPSKHRNSADRLSHLEAVACPYNQIIMPTLLAQTLTIVFMVIQFANCDISKCTNNINAVFVLPTKIIPPPCTQGSSASRAKPAPSTVLSAILACKVTNFSPLSSLLSQKTVKNNRFLHFFCLSERFYLRICYLCSQNQRQSTEGIPRTYRKHTEDIKEHYRTTKYATLWHDRTTTIYWALKDGWDH